MNFFIKIIPLIFFLILIQHSANSQRFWTFELHGGWAGNFPLPLKIQQKGYDDIYIKKAKFYSESLKSPYYWDWRVSKHLDKHSFEFEAIHHKLFLKTSHPDIQRFGISHGFNILTINYSRKYKYFIFRNGIGKVLVHPENTIRNKVYPEGPGFDINGYRLRGIVYNTSIAKQINIIKNRFYLNTELKATFARVKSPIIDGHAIVNNIAFQAIAGFGVKFAGNKKK